MAIVPDDKNWTWVIERPCAECGYDAALIDVGSMAALVRANTAAWPDLLQTEFVRERPSADRWSALEYGCHVRDVYGLFDERLRLMIETDGPHFENWDQDVTAVEQRYDRQNPAVVVDELVAAGSACADRWDSVGTDAWARTGFRSDGASFTIESFARYFLHDVVHHVHDVAGGNAALAASSPG